MADGGAVATRVGTLARRHGRPTAVFSNSDHLQTPTALAAELLGLPAKSWSATLRSKNKLLTRQTVAAAGLDVVAAVEITADDTDDAVESLTSAIPFPAVVKPREGVASEDVALVTDRTELRTALGRVRRGRPRGRRGRGVPPGAAAHLREPRRQRPPRARRLVADGPRARAALRRDAARMEPRLPAAALAHVEAQLDVLGVGLGACHTEFVLQGDRARLVEVNYRLIGDTVDLVAGELLGVDLHAALILVHSGEPLPGLPSTGGGARPRARRLRPRGPSRARSSRRRATAPRDFLTASGSGTAGCAHWARR